MLLHECLRYGQYLAAIQIAREERRAQLEAVEAEEAGEEGAEKEEEEEAEAEDEDNEHGPVGHVDGTTMSTKEPSLWATEEEEEQMELPDYLLGSLQGEAEKEGMLALKKGIGGGQDGGEAKKRKIC